MTFYAGWNQPGYMPESESLETDDFDEARDYIVEELETLADEAAEMDDADLEEAADKAITEAKESRYPFTVYAGGYAFWVDEE